jgi:hypothetical protein
MSRPAHLLTQKRRGVARSDGTDPVRALTHTSALSLGSRPALVLEVS